MLIAAGATLDETEQALGDANERMEKERREMRERYPIAEEPEGQPWHRTTRDTVGKKSKNEEKENGGKVDTTVSGSTYHVVYI